MEEQMPLDATTSSDLFEKYNGPDSAILFPVAERPVGWATRAGGYERIHSHKAIIRLTPSGDAAYALGVVGNNYRLVHNRELFNHVEATMCKQIPAQQLHDVEVRDRVSGFGRTCYRDYVFPRIKCNIGKSAKSDIGFRIIVVNGYGGSALRVHAGAIEFYCSNGMIRGEYQSTYRKHTAGLVVSGIDHAITSSLESFAADQAKWRKWAATPVRHSDAMQLFKDIAQSVKLQEGLTEQYMVESDERGPNLWAVYSAMTYYSSHNTGPFAFRASVEKQDTVATTMLQRELRVSQWTNTDAWHKLEMAT
jgi:Domain of unknown function (DUF932)